MSCTDTLPPSYDQHPSAHLDDPHKELLVQGADEPGTITFSSSTNRTPLYRITDTTGSQIELQDATTSEPLYIIRTDSNSKVYTIIPAPGDTRVRGDGSSAAAAAASITVKPEKITRTGGWVYKASIPSPVQESVRCVWKGSIFQTVELYAKDAAGQRTPIAHYIRKPNGEHFLRLHRVSPPSFQVSSSSSTPLVTSFPELPLLLASLYPFLALYWKYTRVIFTSDKRLNEWSATAQPSKWDARILGKPSGPSATSNGGAKRPDGFGGDRERIQDEDADADADADEKTLGETYDSDDEDVKGSLRGHETPDSNYRDGGAEGEGAEAGSANPPPTRNTESPSRHSTGKTSSRLGKLFGKRGNRSPT